MKALTLQQFRGACAVVDSGFNVSRAATHLHTTQSAVSKTIKGLEGELGIAIFERSSVRMLGLTGYGHDFIELARGILRDAEIAVTRAREDNRRTRGVFRIATTHVHARYALPNVIRTFRSKYPDITVQLDQANTDEIARWVSSRRVHLGISLGSVETPSGLIRLPGAKLERCIVVPPGHELLASERPALADIARYPIVAYHEQHPAGAMLRALFQRNGLQLNIVVTATDATVIKEYVATGTGIAMLHRMAIGPEDERRLAMIDASHVIAPTETQLLLRHGEHLRAYVYDFIETFSPQWSRRAVISEIERQSADFCPVTESAAY